jgi:hypothetical protein
MRAPVAQVVVTDTPERLELLGLVEADVREAGSVGQMSSAPVAEGAEPEVYVQLSS